MDSQTTKPSVTGGVLNLDRRIADLRQELSLLEAEQRAQERQHRADVLRAMRELLLQHGFKPGELTGARATKGTAKSTGKSGSERTPVAPLYRDPATGATWSGRGTEPAWIKGRDRQAFRVAG
jgi:DNA-binding protein H-NS